MIDSGATSNLIKESTAHFIKCPISKSSQVAVQADGQSELKVIGETRLVFSLDNFTFIFEGLVVDHLDVDILAGIPFMTVNDISIRPAKHQVILSNAST